MEEEQEIETARTILDAFRLPPEIQRYDLRAGQDWSGDPALFVTLWINPRWEFDQTKAELLNNAASEVQTRLIKTISSRFPYVTLDQAA